MRDDPIVTNLVTRAQNGDQQAWDALVERYAPLVWSISRRYQLSNADAEDVSQNVWLRLVDQLGSLRDPAAIPGWLVTTTQRECARALRAARTPRVTALAPEIQNIPDAEIGTAEQELLIAERHAALREAFSDLPPRCQQLIALLIEDPPVPYAQISARLGIPVGGIGPSRRRCLDRLRRHPAIAALIDAEDPAGAELQAHTSAATAQPQTGQTPRQGNNQHRRSTMNANDATLTELTTAHTGSTVEDNAPNAPADAGFDLVIEAVAGAAVGNSGAPYTLTISAIDLTAVGQPWPPQLLAQAFNPATGWKLSGAGPDYACTQTIPISVPGGGPGGPLAGHTLQFVASLVSQGAQIVSIIQGNPFVLV